jgi:hypothetical protein
MMKKLLVSVALFLGLSAGAALYVTQTNDQAVTPSASTVKTAEEFAECCPCAIAPEEETVTDNGTSTDRQKCCKCAVTEDLSSEP